MLDGGTHPCHDVETDAASTQVEGRDGSEARLVCFGIGSPEVSEASRYQLALALLLAERLGIRRRSWCDPQMSERDISCGEELGFDLEDPASCARHPFVAARGPTLLFMPHCDRALYEELLEAQLRIAAEMSSAAAATSTSSSAAEHAQFHGSTGSDGCTRGCDRRENSVAAAMNAEQDPVGGSSGNPRPQRLGRLVLLGNSFEAYDARSLLLLQDQGGPISKGPEEKCVVVSQTTHEFTTSNVALSSSVAILAQARGFISLPRARAEMGYLLKAIRPGLRAE